MAGAGVRAATRALTAAGDLTVSADVSAADQLDRLQHLHVAEPGPVRRQVDRRRVHPREQQGRERRRGVHRVHRRRSRARRRQAATSRSTASDDAGIYANAKLVVSSITTNDGGVRFFQQAVNTTVDADFISSQGTQTIDFGDRVRLAADFAIAVVHRLDVRQPGPLAHPGHGRAARQPLRRGAAHDRVGHQAPRHGRPRPSRRGLRGRRRRRRHLQVRRAERPVRPRRPGLLRRPPLGPGRGQRGERVPLPGRRRVARPELAGLLRHHALGRDRRQGRERLRVHGRDGHARPRRRRSTPTSATGSRSSRPSSSRRDSTSRSRRRPRSVASSC